MFFNHRTQLVKVEYKNAGTWTEIERLHYNYYSISKPPVPFTVRLTSIAGDSIEHTFNTIDVKKHTTTLLISHLQPFIARKDS